MYFRIIPGIPSLLVLKIYGKADFLKMVTRVDHGNLRPDLLQTPNTLSYYSSDLTSKFNRDLKNWMSKNKLQIHPTKSKYIFIGSSYNIKNNISNQPILINN